MLTMILKRLIRGVITVVLVTVLIFVLLRVVPGDPAALLAGDDATQETIEQIRVAWGLDKPIMEQFFIYIGNLLRGNAGMSYQYRTNFSHELVWTVTDLVRSRLPYTIMLASAALLINIVVALPLGVLTAMKKGSLLDTTVMGLGSVILAFPHFFIGLIYILLFAITLKWVPAGGYGSFKHLLLPALTLSMHYNVQLTRLTRTEIGQNLASDYIRMCRAKGLSQYRVLFVHGLRNAAIPVVTMLGLRFGTMMGGSVVVESLYRWPGIGSLLIDAVNTRDYPTVQYLVPYVAVVFIVVNIVVDILYGLLDPRIRNKS